jgi:signal transduction histidine kinase
VEPSRRAIFQSEVEQYGRAKDFELQLRKKDGTVMHCVLTATVRTDKDGAILGYQGIVRDVTEEIRNQEVLHRSKKMEALAHMAGGVAHEIRNPLAISSSAAQLLMEDQLPCHLRRECAGKIVSGINRASLIIENLFTFAQPMHACEMKRVNLVPLVRATLKTLTIGTLSHQVEVVSEFSGEPVSVLGNAQSLQRVFLNLFSNALAALAHGGTLRVAVDRNDLDAIVTVSDSGHGIDQEAVEKMFDPFFSECSAAGGAGLGLSVAYSTVTQHGGSICVESAAGQGTTVRVSLPLNRPVHGTP